MDNVYHIHNSPAQQQQQQQQQQSRSSQSATMAPTAAMLDPSLGNHGKASQLSHEFGSPQMRRNSAVLNNHHHHDLQPMLEHDSSRALPSIEVTDASLDNAYIDFILYCNPSIPINVDTTELRKGFRSPPKSDGKSFSPFVLFGLISKLESKEIKTWTQLVIDLGVELPDPNKNQSSQKVQQYAVRLKRWLHAFHVDAFFHYCLSIPNTYYTDRPVGGESLTEGPRDGVAPEEDLALRALVPEWRPKRGRRKAEEPELENTPSRKAQFRRSASNELFSSSFDEHYPTNPSSAVPWSAQTQGQAWAASQVAIAPKEQNTGQTPLSGHLFAQPAGQQIRWKLNHQENAPSMPYPQSAITPRHHYSASPAFEEPRSANPTSLGKSSSGPSRKRRGPAVSSAWPASNGASTGKIRGRPPSNRSVQDGPFSTFPANPSLKEGPTINVSTPTQLANPSLNQGGSDQSVQNMQRSEVRVSPKVAAADLSQVRKPSKLQLQVPEHAGGPVRLATPPQVLINGENNRQSQSSQERRSSADFFNQLDDDDASDMMDMDGDVDGDGGNEIGNGNGNGNTNIDWKRRALVLRRKLREKEDELKALKRRVLDAVM